MTRLHLLLPFLFHFIQASLSLELDCANGRNCYYPKACNKKLSPSCQFAFSYQLAGDFLSLELAGGKTSESGVYIAMAFSDNDKMADSHVTECSSIGEEKKVSVKLSYNNNSPVNERIKDEPSIRDNVVRNASYLFSDGILLCRWTQLLRLPPSMPQQLFNLTADSNADQLLVYILMATGVTDKNGLVEHEFEACDLVQVDLKSGVLTGDTPTNKLIKAHGCLMMLAWLFFVPLAVLFARFLRSHWPDTKPGGLLIWFHIHRSSNTLAIAIMIAGFICILVSNDWKWTGIGSTNSFNATVAHSTFGLLALILAWLQPFVSAVRCTPSNPRRPLFNWTHRCIGVVAFLSAVTAVGLAAFNFSIWTPNGVPGLVLALLPLPLVFALFIATSIVDFAVDPESTEQYKKGQNARLVLVLAIVTLLAANASALVAILITT